MLPPHRVSALLKAAHCHCFHQSATQTQIHLVMDGKSGQAPSLQDRNQNPVCVSAAVMNDPGAPADECVVPDCLRSPAAAIRMSSSKDETLRLALSSAAADFCAAPSLCGFIQTPLPSRCKDTSSSKNICGGNKSWLVVLKEKK